MAETPQNTKRVLIKRWMYAGEHAIIDRQATSSLGGVGYYGGSTLVNKYFITIFDRSNSSRSVKDYLIEINDYIFLPRLQREFVRSPSQIANLFESLIRDYPVEILTEWNLRSSNVESFNSYRLLTDYITTEGHPPDEVLGAGFSRHNTPMGDDATLEILIIDGQQRLNSLYIGVCGQITEYSGGRGYPRDDVSNWKRKELCIDLFGHPDFGSDDVRGDYEFRFRRVEGFGQTVQSDYERVRGEHHLWMPVGDPWDTEEGGLVNQGKMRDIVEEYLENGIPAFVPTTYENEDGETIHAKPSGSRRAYPYQQNPIVNL